MKPHVLALCGLIILPLLVGCAAAAPIPATATPTATQTPAATPIPTVPPTPGLEAGRFALTLPNGKLFGGRIRGYGETAIILANMSTGSDTQWSRLVNELDEERYTVITFYWIDHTTSPRAQAKAILEHLRAGGFTRVICIGASVGVSACGSLADQPEIVGLALIAGQYSGSLAEADYPKLFLAGEDDFVARDIIRLHEAAPEPKVLRLFPSSAHGTELFGTSSGGDFLQAILTFIEVAAAAGA